MASPTSSWWRCSWKTPPPTTTTNDSSSAIKSSSSSHSYSYSSSIFLSLHINNRRTRISSTTFCLHDHDHDPDPPPSYSSDSSSSHSGIKFKKYGEVDFSVSKPPEDASGENAATQKKSTTNKIEVPRNRIEFHKGKSLSFNSLFGKKFLWKRILFASTKVRSILLLNVITLIYASNIPVVKEVEAIMDPAAFTVVRFVMTAIPFIPFVFKARGDIQTRNAGIELGFWVSLGYLMQALGLLTSDAGRASFISMFTIIVVPLLDGMFGAKIPARTWFGALMSIVGVGMLESSGSPPSVGDLLNFLSAVFFGIHMLRTEQISRSANIKNFLPLLGYEVCVVAVLSTVWYVVGFWYGGIEEFDPSSFTWRMVLDWMVAFPWVPALYTGIFSTGICLWVEMVAMRDVSATETAIIYGLEPVWGAAFAWFLLGERWGTIGWIGAALVLGGSLTVQILGSSSPSTSSGAKDIIVKDDRLVSEKQKFLSASPVVVSSRKPVSDLLKK